jgi:hypothetical protein
MDGPWTASTGQVHSLRDLETADRVLGNLGTFDTPTYESVVDAVGLAGVRAGLGASRCGSRAGRPPAMPSSSSDKSPPMKSVSAAGTRK